MPQADRLLPAAAQLHISPQQLRFERHGVPLLTMLWVLLPLLILLLLSQLLLYLPLLLPPSVLQE